MKKKIKLNSIPFKIVVAVILFIVSLVFFSLIAHEVVVEKEHWFDSKVFAFLSQYTSVEVIRLFEFFTFFGSAYFLLSGYLLLVVFLLYKKRKSDVTDISVLGLTVAALLYGLKTVFARSRPDLPLIRELDTYSFPSGHTLLSFVFFSLLIHEVWQFKTAKAIKWMLSVFLVFFSLAVGISRVVLRYHYASDVVAGFCLGLAYVMLFFWVQNIFRKKGNVYRW